MFIFSSIVSMKYILRFLFALVLAVFWFGLYKHDFDIVAYANYLQSEWSSTFLEKWDISSPSTWTLLLYDDEIKQNELSLLEQELEKINKLTDFDENTATWALNTWDQEWNSLSWVALSWSILSWSTLSWSVFSWSAYSGAMLSWLNDTNTAWMSGWKKDDSTDTEDDPFSDFAWFFDAIDDVESSDTPTIWFTGSTEPSPSGSWTSLNQSPKPVQPNAPTQPQPSKTWSSKLSWSVEQNSIVLSWATKTEDALLQKRLEQYKTYKKSLAE